MLRTPLKNSKNVNKPFKSPFDSSTPSRDLCKSGKKSTKKAPVQSPLSSSISTNRNLEAKRILLLDENEPELKRQRLSDTDSENIQKQVPENATKSENIQKLVPENATKSELHLLKRKIFEMRQELDCLKSRERCTKKHDPKELKASIDKWRSACQNALEIICSELTERNGQSTKVSDVLNMLGIPETLVHYSQKEDMFI